MQKNKYLVSPVLLVCISKLPPSRGLLRAVLETPRYHRIWPGRCLVRRLANMAYRAQLLFRPAIIRRGRVEEQRSPRPPKCTCHQSNLSCSVGFLKHDVGELRCVSHSHGSAQKQARSSSKSFQKAHRMPAAPLESRDTDLDRYPLALGTCSQDYKSINMNIISWVCLLRDLDLTGRSLGCKPWLQPKPSGMFLARQSSCREHCPAFLFQLLGMCLKKTMFCVSSNNRKARRF